jgi:hypothetical protein
MKESFLKPSLRKTNSKQLLKAWDITTVKENIMVKTLMRPLLRPPSSGIKTRVYLTMFRQFLTMRKSTLKIQSYGFLQEFSRPFSLKKVDFLSLVEFPT